MVAKTFIYYQGF